ncbi:hypothetical protein [Methylobacterium sp. Leaf118]|uniref:hypothetical protein n=1 Tax=Methylobacterium sp. Leaf118 TaxID=2876562 RepID=UPI001E423A77|nr:hypothetical protein [Methylobacterium sp. Leaf118]
MATLLRLTLLLVGKPAIRTRWPVFVGAALACLALSAVFVLDLHGLSVAATTGLFALGLAGLGLRRLALPAQAGGRHGPWLPRGVGLGLLALAGLALRNPWDDDLVATVVVAAALGLDGLHRSVSVALIRPVGWGRPFTLAIAEFLLAGMIALPSPIPSGHAAAFVIGLLFARAAALLGGFGLALRRSAEAPPPARPDPTEIPLTLHVWSPAGGGRAAPHRFLVDRYIAAVGADGLLKTGHIALSRPPDLYVSLCPIEEFDQSRHDFRRMLVGRPHNDVPGTFLPSLAAESRRRGSPDREVCFPCYDAAALARFLSVYRQAEHYNLTRRNCASTVALCLDAALAGVLGGPAAFQTALRLLVDPRMWRAAFWRTRAEAMTWTPGLLFDYARAVQGALDAARLRSVPEAPSKAREPSPPGVPRQVPGRQR